MRGVRGADDVGLAGRLARSSSALLVLLLIVAAGALVPAYLAIVSVNRSSVDAVADAITAVDTRRFARFVVEPRLADGRLTAREAADIRRILLTAPGVRGGRVRDTRGRVLLETGATQPGKDVLAATVPAGPGGGPSGGPATLELTLDAAPVQRAIRDDTRAMQYILALVAIAFYAALFPVLRTSARALAKAHADRHPGLQRELRGAMRRGELALHYQPKLELATGAVPSVEALLRWQPPGRGTVPPGEFLPQIEDTALMDELTEHVVGLGARQLAEWRADGIDVTLAINVSPRLLGYPELPGRLGDILGDRGVEAEEAIIELTENAVMARHDVTRQTLDELVNCGFELSIDDFGTGRSSLDRLDRLPVDELKIDRAFIARMEETEETTLVSAMIRLAHELGMRVVAEGVESRRTVDLLRSLGCDLVQGYAISRPVPDDELRRWLDARSRWDAPGDRVRT